MKKRTVSIFIPSYRIGGAEKVLVLLANRFLEHFDEVHMLSTSSEGPLAAELDPAVKRIDLECQSYKRVFVKLIAYYNQRRPDVVLTSIYATGIVAAAARVVSKHKPVLMIGAHNSFSAKLAAPDNAKDRFLLKPLARLFLRGADAVVPVSHGVADDLARTLALPPGKLHVIYNPVVSPVLLAMARRDVTHPWLGDREERRYKTVLAVGRLVPQKAFDVLLRAFHRLPRRDEFRLVIVGDGVEAGNLQALALSLGLSNHVDFVGYDTNPYRFMSRADLFVLSSNWEGLPTVLIEAMACGCPVVATDCPYGPAEILNHGQFGTLVPMADPDALAAAIVAVLAPGDSGVDRAAPRRRADDFTDVRATGAYVSLINNLLGHRADVT